jgi:hypothetical protein
LNFAKQNSFGRAATTRFAEGRAFHFVEGFAVPLAKKHSFFSKRVLFLLGGRCGAYRPPLPSRLRLPYQPPLPPQFLRFLYTLGWQAANENTSIINILSAFQDFFIFLQMLMVK